MIELACEKCGRRGAAKDEWAGRSVRCPGCGGAIVVPGAAAEPDAPAQGPPRQPGTASRTASNSRPVAASRPSSASTARSATEKKPPTSPAARTSAAAAASRSASPARPRKPSPAPPQPRRDTAPEIVEATAIDDPAPVASGIDDLLSGALADSGIGDSAFGGSPLHGPLGASPTRPRAKKKSSNAIIWIILGVVGALAVVAVVIVVMVVMAMNAARKNLATQPLAGTAAGQASPAALSGPVWNPDANLANQLGPEITFDRHAWRMPATLSSSPAPAAAAPPGARLQNHLWMSPQDAQGTRTVATASVIEFNQAIPREPNDLEQALAGLLKALPGSGGMQGFSHSQGERGQVGGKQVIRCRFSGQKMGVAIHGMVLMNIDGTQLVTLSVMCADPPGSPTFNLLEAALFTYR